ncbi:MULTISPECIES: xylulokinase [unclassified Sphingomonas]|uniref:xylulokinase n=1 Tax=unclassified Sphingomonas TaxID=196159 RepID=UPI000E74DB59|nr:MULTISPECIES: xylulokinase [unclassified Sphingomonas]RKE53791.1 xylulokinase [Sphingomonas sp. PP-CC-1A-547]TCM10286.1 xylulokinase [Sphingomonas sp. PP-CC-3G-468]
MFLGIDIGTSGVKAVVLDQHGSVVGQGTAALTVQRPHPLWSEQDPDAWWKATIAAVQAIDPSVRRSVRGVGLAGQMHGATLLDADDRPLRPAILWNDGRCFAECEALERAVPNLRTISGNIAMPGFTAPKLLWVREHEPEVFAKIATVLLPKDYVRLLMTGDKASDLSDSAGTLWLDVGGRCWSDEILAACGLTQAQMPALYEGTEITGTLTAEVAELWGMPQVPVAAGGSDNAAGAVGVGVVKDGDALLSLGTSGVIFVATNDFRPNPARAVHAFCHALPGMWHQMSVHLSAASCIDWVARITGAAGAADLFARAEAAGPASGPEIFLPYLSGERTPHNDPEVRGAFLRLDNDTDAGRLSQAVLEGVAFALADGLDVLREAGTTVERLAVIGGGARSRYWGQVIAAAMEVELVYLQGGEVGPALGAARLAQLGVDGGDPAEICVAPPVSHTIVPDPALVSALAEKKAAFRQAYSRITPKS